jgi:hypothetical protein
VRRKKLTRRTYTQGRSQSWPRQRLGLDARAIVVESERSGWPLSAQASETAVDSSGGTAGGETRLGRIL